MAFHSNMASSSIQLQVNSLKTNSYLDQISYLVNTLQYEIKKVFFLWSELTCHCQGMSSHSNGSVPQLSIMIIYNSTWSILVSWISDILSGDKVDLVNTKESLLSVYDKTYHTNKGILQKWRKLSICETMH